MPRTILFSILIILSTNLLSQTFHLVIDPVEGDETDFHNNSVIDMVVSDDQVILSGQHLCSQLPESENGIFCASLSSFDLDGKFNKSILIDTFFDAQSGGLLAVGSRIFTANYKHKDPFIGRSLYIQEYNQSLELVSQNIIPNRPGGSTNNYGLKFIQGNFYTYGDFVNPGPTKGFIQKLDADFNLIWDKQYEHEKAVNSCDKLQETIDGDLVFAHQYRSEVAGPSNTGLQIVKLNTDGIKQDSLEIDGEGHEIAGLALLSDAEGMVYTFTSGHPSDESIFEQSQGRINKYSSNLDTLLWSLKLPTNISIDRRTYFITDFELAKNGDLLACGSVFDNSPDGNTTLQNNFTVNAFMIRVSKEGEIKWFHLYKIPNVNNLLPVEEFGNFHTSALARMVELEDGRIIAAGSSRLTNKQQSIVFGTTDPWSQFLILAVDGETGCIDGEECNEIVILDGEDRPRGNYLPVINSDYLWTAERTNENGFAEEISYTYSTDSVLQFIEYYFERIENPSQTGSTPLVSGYFKEAGGRVDQFSGMSYSAKVVFDIHLQAGEVITVERENGPIDLIAISTDTIIFQDEIPRKRIFLECISEQTTTDPIVWIEGIGELDNNESCGLVNPRTQILCVSDKAGNTIYSLNEMGCEGLFSACAPASFSVGDKWTYNDHIYSEISFEDFEIVNEMEWMGEQAMVVEPGLLDGEDYMIQENSKVYFWDENLGEYQLNYDFDNDSTYYIRYFSFLSDEVDSTAVYVDSIRVVNFNGQELEVQYCRSDFGFGGIPWTVEVIKGIGSSTFGPRLPISIIIDNFSGGIGDIRCFESSDCSIQFVDFPCDTIFNPLSLGKSVEDLGLNIYPNPVQNKLYLEMEEQDLNYQIINLQGQIVKSGAYQDNIEVFDLPSGIYFLQIEQKGQFYRAMKFVKE